MKNHDDDDDDYDDDNDYDDYDYDDDDDDENLIAVNSCHANRLYFLAAEIPSQHTFPLTAHLPCKSTYMPADPNPTTLIQVLLN